MIENLKRDAHPMQRIRIFFFEFYKMRNDIPIKEWTLIREQATIYQKSNIVYN